MWTYMIFFNLEMLQNIMKASKILHNIIIEDEWDENEAINFDYEQVNEILIHYVEQSTK